MLRRVRVQGGSMLPTLRPGQRLLVATWAYRWRGPRRGEVVVVRHPSRPLALVKRVAALPGDVVQGRPLGPEDYWVVGDNPGGSTDSSAFGAVRRASLVGRVLCSYRPAALVR